MAIEAFDIQRLRVYVETNTQFSQDHTGTLGDFSDVPIQGTASFTKPRELYDPALVQQRIDGKTEKVIGRRGPWTLTFTVPLAGTGTAATNGVAAINDVLGKLFKACMGAENLGTGTTATAALAATGYTVGGNTGLVSGMPLGTTISGALQWRPEKTISGTSVTHALATTAAPSGGAVVVASALYTLTEDPDTTLQFIVHHGGNYGAWVLMGGQGTFSINVPRNGIPTATFTITGHYWLPASEAVGAGGELDDPPTPATYPSLGYALAESGEFLQWTNGTATYTASNPYTTEGSQVHIADETWTFNVTWVDVPSPNTPAVEGILRKRRLKAEVGLQFRAPHQSHIWHTARASSLDKGFFRVIGGTGGSTVTMHLPTGQVTDVEIVNVDGMLYDAVSVEGRLDGETTASGAPQWSIFKLGRG